MDARCISLYFQGEGVFSGIKGRKRIFFDCYWLPDYTMEKSLVTKYFHAFSGTICQRNWIVVFSHFFFLSLYTLWYMQLVVNIVYLGWLNEDELIDCMNVKLWTRKYWDELQILVKTDSDQEILSMRYMQMWFTFIADIYCINGRRVEIAVKWMNISDFIFRNLSNHT